MSFSFQEQRKNGRGNSPGSRAGMANLVPYKPGQSGNPGGRPKGTPSLEHAMMRLLALSSEELKAFEPQNQAEEIALQRIKDAGAALNPVAIKATEMILNRVDGPVEKRVTIEQIQHGVREQAIKDFACYSQISANIHNKYCGGPEGCVCLSREQIVSAILAGFPERHREMAAQAIAEEFPELLTG